MQTELTDRNTRIAAKVLTIIEGLNSLNRLLCDMINDEFLMEVKDSTYQKNMDKDGVDTIPF